MRKAASLAGLMALALASPIHAHVGIWADSIFSLAHPVGGWGQVLAVLSIGLVSAQGGQRSLRMLLLAFLLSAVLGSIVGPAVPSPTAQILFALCLMAMAVTTTISGRSVLVLAVPTLGCGLLHTALTSPSGHHASLANVTLFAITTIGLLTIGALLGSIARAELQSNVKARVLAIGTTVGAALAVSL